MGSEPAERDGARDGRRQRAPQPSAAPTGRLKVAPNGDAAERDADATAARVLAGLTLGSTPGPEPAGRIRRAPAPGVVQRKIAFKSSALKGGSAKSKIKMTTWVEIKKHLSDYEEAPPGTELMHLQVIEMLCKEWLAGHAESASKPVAEQRTQVATLLQQVEAEIGTMGAAQDAQYMSRLQSHRTPGAKGADNPFKFVTGSGAKGLTSTAPPRNAPPGPLPHGLTEPELAAIRVYTGGDYRTMNPTIEGNDAWLEKQTHELTGEQGNKDASKNFVGKEGGWADPETKQRMEKAKTKPDRFDRRRIKVEAMQHTRVALSGLNKLPSKDGEGYRGFTTTKAQLDSTYGLGAEITYKPFVSTSTKRDISEGYAKLAQAPEVGVLLVLTITDGRDVDDISLAKGEGEILLLPGAKFRVTRGPHLASPPPAAAGQPVPQSKVWIVEASQVGGAGGATGNVAAPVPLNALPPTAQQVVPGAQPAAVPAPVAAPPMPAQIPAVPALPQPPGQQPAQRPRLSDIAARLGPAPQPPGQQQLPPAPPQVAGLPQQMPAQLPAAPAPPQRPGQQAAAPALGLAPQRPGAATPNQIPAQVPAAPAPVPAIAHQGVAAPQVHDPDAELQRAADAKADELVARYAKAEPPVTKLLSAQAKAHSAKLEGLQHRLKTKSSLSRKLADRARTTVRNDDYATAVSMQAMGLNDVLRYTLITGESKYLKLEKAVTEELARAGYARGQRWDAWGDSKAIAYNGLNLTFATKDGVMFELQIHTQKSFDTKTEIHDLYEEQRGATTSDQRKSELGEQMKERWKSVPAPAGITPAPNKGMQPAKKKGLF